MWLILALCAGAITIAHGAAMFDDRAIILGYGALFLPYIALLWSSSRAPVRLPDLKTIVLAAIATRLALTLAEPLLSDDIYRYVWDGYVAKAGINPFAHAPNHDALSSVRDGDIWPKINHPTLPTIYPPAAQYLFWLNALLGGKTTLMRLLFVAIELLTAFFFYRHTQRQKTPPHTLKHLAIIYWLNPLVMIEVAWSGHVDVLAWSFLVIAMLWFTQREKHHTWWTHLPTGFALGVSISAKFLGLMALPILCFAPKPDHITTKQLLIRRTILAITTLTVFTLSYTPYLDLGKGVFGSLGKYAASWKTNDSVFRLIDRGSQSALRSMAKPKDRINPEDPNSKVVVRLSQWDDVFVQQGWTKTWQGKQIPNTSWMEHQVSATLGKLAALFFMGLMLLWCLIVIRNPARSIALLFLTLYLVAPTVMPWYVAWLVPLSLLISAKHRPVLLTYSAVIICAYTAWISVRQQGPWLVPDAWIAFELITLLAVWWWRDRLVKIKLFCPDTQHQTK